MLNLGHTWVTGPGLEHLSGLSQLRKLNLYDSGMTDAGLKYLAGLTQVRELNLERTRVTLAGVRNLQKALTDCIIQHDAPL
jgi:internalin A